MQIKVTLVTPVALTRILMIWSPAMQLLHSLLMKTCSLVLALKQAVHSSGLLLLHELELNW